jgi:hypothetical protein
MGFHHMARKKRLEVDWDKIPDRDESYYAERDIAWYADSILRDLDRLANKLTHLPFNEGHYNGQQIALALRSAIKQWHGRPHSKAKRDGFDNSLKQPQLLAKIVGEVFQIPTREERRERKAVSMCDWIIEEREKNET